jgi:hypothetical protein
MRQKIAFQPPLALMLAQHFHDAAIGGDVVVEGRDLRRRTSGRGFKNSVPAVRVRFVRTELTKVVVI